MGTQIKEHTIGGPCWCGYKGMKLFQDRQDPETRAGQEYKPKGVFSR